MWVREKTRGREIGKGFLDGYPPELVLVLFRTGEWLSLTFSLMYTSMDFLWLPNLWGSLTWKGLWKIETYLFQLVLSNASISSWVSSKKLVPLYARLLTFLGAPSGQILEQPWPDSLIHGFICSMQHWSDVTYTVVTPLYSVAEGGLCQYIFFQAVSVMQFPSNREWDTF